MTQRDFEKNFKYLWVVINEIKAIKKAIGTKRKEGIKKINWNHVQSKNRETLPKFFELADATKVSRRELN